MFGELLESRAKRARNHSGAVVSVVGHALFITLAVVATRKPLVATSPAERVYRLPVLETPVPVAPRPEDRSARTTGPSTPSVPAPLPFVPPVIVLPGIPPVDLTAPPATGLAWPSEGPAVKGGIVPRGSAEGEAGIPFATGVDKPAIALSGNPSPRYPEALRRAAVRGEVVIQVVIDTTGRADMGTVRVMSSDHALLTSAVIDALPRARFLPAETGGRKVRMWAMQSFVFEVR
jgi:protein TonB